MMIISPNLFHANTAAQTGSRIAPGWRAVCRGKAIIGIPEAHIDLDGYQAYVDGKPVELTHREFEVLQLLLRNQGRVLTRQMLLNQLWDFDFLGDERVVDTILKICARSCS